MLKRIITLLVTSMICLLAVAQEVEVSGEYLSSLGDKKSYKLVQKEENAAICDTFLHAFPESKYRKKVTVIYDMRYYIEAYDLATKTFDLSSLEGYLLKFPKGDYRLKAEEALDIISWQKAKSKNTIPGYQEYIKNYPKGRALTLAKKALSNLK